VLASAAALLAWWLFRDDRPARPGRGDGVQPPAAPLAPDGEPERAPAGKPSGSDEPDAPAPRPRAGPFLRTGSHAGATLAPGRGAIDFALELPPGLDAGAFHVVLFEERAGGLRREGARGPWGDARFTFPDLEPGRYTVRYFLTGDATPLANIDGVVVEAGKVARDERLAQPPLAMHVRPATVTVVDRDGRPVEGAQICLDAAPGSVYGESHVVTTDARGRATFPVSARGQRPVLRKRGHLVTDGGLVTADARLVLPRGLPVTLRVQANGRELPDDVVLLLRFNHQDTGGGESRLDAWVPYFQTWIESLRDPVELRAPRHGRYAVEAYLAPRDARRWTDSLPRTIGSFPDDFEVTVEDRPGGQKLVLAMPSDDLDTALSDLRQEQRSD